jgi:hydrogenase maturation protein HypF
MTASKRIIIKGLVQGVGFRPAIYRMADLHNLNGTVENNNTGVIINIEGDEKDVTNFIIDIPIRTPVASSITDVKIINCDIKNYSDFSITRSTSQSDEVTEVSPDIGVCEECLHDIKNQENRINYAFTNCTNCGPRFTIIKDLPYDRPKTTMDVFPMCDKCNSEYVTILDRRFHAQPVACNKCGPHYSLHLNGDTINDIDSIVKISASLIDEGKILAIKGLGGYHLACNTFNNQSIEKLRFVKSREGKPLAIMFKDITSAKEYLHINDEEEKELTNWRRPIVLLKIKKAISESVSIGLDTVGVMLPYMPFHYMLFEELSTSSIVLTSGNISDEPVIISNQEALEKLSKITDAVITYNRDIYNRTDDSVTTIINNTPRLIRRSRSYAPSPITLDINTEGIFAAGAELVNCFCIGKGNQAILSQHIGDLKNLETLDFFKESVERFSRLFRFNPSIAVVDLHPDYLSSTFVSKMNIPFIKVQHHHAHIASCMAEHKLDEKIIGISFDGTGLGDDGNIWGAEFMVCDLADYERYTHFEYIPQPGGDAVSKHPWRMMTSYILHYFGNDAINDYQFLFNGVDKQELSTVKSIINSNLNCPLTSSAGRLFDAVSALIGVCINSTYHSEAPMQLESIADYNVGDSYGWNITDDISFKTTFAEIIEDLKEQVSISVIAGKFHNTIVDVIVSIAKTMREKEKINKVVLSGGSFQNKILLKKTELELSNNGFEYFTQSQIPSNDGGLALGQLAICAKRRQLKII